MSSPTEPTLPELVPLALYAVEDFYVELGVAEDATAGQIIQAYVSARKLAPCPVKRCIAKLLTDKYYSQCYRQYHSVPLLVEAGFFDDATEPEQWLDTCLSTAVLTTPLDKVRTRLMCRRPRQRAAVLVSTGGFAPVHRGHLAMMESARHALEEAGILVAGGFLSPSHDSYVSTKHGEQDLHAPNRIALCHEAVAASDWLDVDSWEACYTATAINFTDVLARLDAYLARHLASSYAEPVELFYVFGSDNAGFARAFTAHGACVVVGRPGHPTNFSHDAPVLASPNIFSATTTHDPISSTHVRATRHPSAVDVVVDNLFVLRDDAIEATSAWAPAFPAIDDQLKLLRSRTIDALTDALPTTIDVRPIRYASPNLGRRAPSRATKTLSLDVWYTGDAQIAMSRQFALSAGQLTPTAVVPRPGYPLLAEQAASVSPGQYIIVDDDIASGATVRAVQDLLADTVTVDDVVTLAPRATFDVVDMRDFIVGAHHSGLVSTLVTGETVRAPYAAPYVNVATRAKLLPNRMLEFSRRIWQANIEFFSAAVIPLTVRDANPETRRLLTYIGFAVDASLEAVCRWHLEHLTDLEFTPHSTQPMTAHHMFGTST